MNILYIGGGFVGSCSAAVAADSGHATLVYDIDEKKIAQLSSGDRDEIESCLFETGLGDLIIRNKERIQFTSVYRDVEARLDTADAIFMCLPTPEVGESGESDLSYYDAAAHALGKAMALRNHGQQSHYIVVVNKSTVPIDMVDTTKQIFDSYGCRNYGIVSNPEFLVEGKAIQGSLKPDRIVVGASTHQDFEIMRRVYQRFYGSSEVSYIEVTPKEAAAGKLLANFYLFAKLALCFDVIGRTAEVFSDIEFESLRKIISSDKRIGNWGFHDSLYAGGSCLIKDARSLAHQLGQQHTAVSFVEEVYNANKRQIQNFFERSIREAHIAWDEKKVALLGTSFKRDTNDIRNSASVVLLDMMSVYNPSQIYIYDPVAQASFQAVYPATNTILYVDSEEEALQDADIIIISTDWPQFRGIADKLLEANLAHPVLIMDGRRLLKHRYSELQSHGYDILAVGSPFIKGTR